MKSFITVTRLTMALLLASFLQFSCTPVSNENEAVQSISISMETQMEKQNDHFLLPGGELSKDQVCMVNNSFMGKKQIPVAYENKTYYGCCEMCVEKIKTNKAVRYATDPLSGKEVDKATAFISLNPTTHDGTVLYFESEESFKHYKSKSYGN